MIVFLSDNGGRLDAANNGQFRGHKGMLFEGGIRVPFAISWPDQLQQGIMYDDPVISLDLYNTCMQVAGLNEDKSLKLDGVNLLPYLNGSKQEAPHEALYWRVANGEEFAVRKGNYKLIKSAYKNKTLLFDLSKDEMEINDISKEQPIVFEEMLRLYEKWNNTLDEPSWTDPHIENVNKEEAQVQSIKLKSLSKKERENIN